MSADSPRRVRVLVNALHARSGGGVTYLRNMLPHLAADPRLEIRLLLHRTQRGLLPTADSRIAVHEVDFPDGFLRVLLWEQLRLPGLARRLGAQVTFSPANFGPLCAPGSVILLRNALAVGELDRRLAKRAYWAALSLMTGLSLLASRRAIAVSGYARAALTRCLPERIQRKVTVVHHGVNPRFTPAAAPPAEEQPFLLAVGDIYLQKNLHGLVAALPEVARTHPGIVLKIAGAPIDAAYLHRVKAEAEALGVGGRIAFLGRRSEDELIALYRGCTVFVFPSTVETFGNPLLEAMACGAPIASADSAAMPEVVGDAALLFDPARPDDIARAVGRLLDDAPLCRALAARGLQRARGFSWERTAAATAEVLLAAAGESSARPGPATEALLWGFVIAATGLYLLQFRSILPAVLALFGFA